MKTAGLAARMGTQRARVRTLSIKLIVAVSPGRLAWWHWWRDGGRHYERSSSDIVFDGSHLATPPKTIQLVGLCQRVAE